MFFTILMYLCLLFATAAGICIFLLQIAFWSRKLVTGKTAKAGVRFLLFLSYMGALIFLLRGIIENNQLLVVFCAAVSVSQLFLWKKRWSLWSWICVSRRGLIGGLFLAAASAYGAVCCEDAYHRYKWNHAQRYEVVGYTAVTETTEEVQNGGALRKNIGVTIKQTHIVLDNGEKVSLQNAGQTPDDKSFYEIGDSVRLYNDVIVRPI